ncbi:MAG: gamma-glutamyltransferase [Acholeplasmataceae bacterium]
MTMQTVFKRFLLFMLVITSIFALAACNSDEDDDDDNGTDPKDVTDYHDLTVRESFGENGMVATASSYATKVGLDILKDGGNAFDAAIAVAFALGVTEPNASGIGGGGFMVTYNAETGERIGYDYREFAPEAATVELYQSDENLDVRSGPGSFGVPMFVDGMLTIHEDLATMDLDELVEPAITLAREGFEVKPSLAEAIDSQFGKLMTSREEALEIYSADGFSAMTVGDTLINEDLARVMETIVEDGRDGFYKSDIARAIVSAVQDAGGIVTMSDMHRAIGSTIKDEALTGTYKDYDIVSMYPPSSGGTTLIQIFNMLEFYETVYGPISELDHNSAEYLNLLAQTMQLAYGDRRRYVGDPLFVEVPIQGLMSKDFAEERMELFDPEQGGTFTGTDQYGDPWAHQDDDALAHGDQHLAQDEGESGSTTHFTIVDEQGNTVSSTNTINYFFGNGIIPAGTGIILNNIMSPFSMYQTAAELKPFKRPLSNMSPSIVLSDGEPFMAIGSPGSMRITSAIVQVLLNVIEYDMDVQSAIESPRIFHYVGKNLEIEEDMGQSVIDALSDLGYDPDVYSGIDLYFGGVQAITIDPDTGELHGGADTRRDGKALGY